MLLPQVFLSVLITLSKLWGTLFFQFSDKKVSVVLGKWEREGERGKGIWKYYVNVASSELNILNVHVDRHRKTE